MVMSEGALCDQIDTHTAATALPFYTSMNSHAGKSNAVMQTQSAEQQYFATAINESRC
jgi:hypothetical protein